MTGKTVQKWRKTPACGEPIKDGLFLAFKTPYDNTNINEDDHFTVEIVYDLFHLKEVDVGLVIDLTKTDRYYDKTKLEKRKIEHFKLPCRGFDEPPTPEETATFIAKCKAFRQKNPTKCIGVHCTNGLNRTGFLICAYLAEELKMNIHDAINLFKTCRPPGIEKEFDKEELVRRYGDPDLEEEISKKLSTLNVDENDNEKESNKSKVNLKAF